MLASARVRGVREIPTRAGNFVDEVDAVGTTICYGDGPGGVWKPATLCFSNRVVSAPFSRVRQLPRMSLMLVAGACAAVFSLLHSS
jgi:hypothetical protein